MTTTVENERLCPSVITDEVHLPSATIPLSVPVVIYVTESGFGIFESSGNGIVRHGRVADDSRSHVEAVEIQIHEGLRQADRDLVRGLRKCGGVGPTLGPSGRVINFTLRYTKADNCWVRGFLSPLQATRTCGELA